MMRSDNGASCAGGRAMSVGVTKIRVASARSETTRAPRIHVPLHGVAIEQTSINVRRAPLDSGLIGPKIQEGRHAEQARADDRRQEAGAPTFEGAVGDDADRGDGERGGTEEPAREPEEFSETV